MMFDDLCDVFGAFSLEKIVGEVESRQCPIGAETNRELVRELSAAVILR